MSKGRAIATGVAVIAVLATIPSLMPAGAKKKTPIPFAGGITLTSPTSNAALSGKSAKASWSWKPGSLVKSTSHVDFQVSKNGSSWQTIAAGVPIRDGQLTWDTNSASDAVYSARILVSSTTIASAVDSVYVDNTKPQITITDPSQSEVLVDSGTDSGATQVYFTVALGNTHLKALAFDGLSGIDHVDWTLDGKSIDAHGADTTYDFKSQQPNFYDLGATAYDRAGNKQDSATVKIFTGPGPSALGTLPSPCASDPTSGAPVDPCTQKIPSGVAPCPLGTTNPDPSHIPNDPCSIPNSVSPCPLATNPLAGTVDPCAKQTPPTVPSPTPSQSPPTSKELPVACTSPDPTKPAPPHCTVF